MHRTNPWLRTTTCHLLLGLVLGGWITAGRGAAQEARPAEGAPPVVLPPPRPETSPVAGGSTITVAIGGNRRLQMHNRQPIRTAINEKENIATVSPIPGEPTLVNITGREAGTTLLTLVGEDNSTERYQIIVELDVAYLRSVLQRAVPTATLDLIPGANGVIIVSGTVLRADDITTILNTAAGVAGGPDRVVNALRLEGVMQVQLDVVVAFVSRSAMRRMSFDFIQRGRTHTISSLLGGGASQVGPLGTIPSAGVGGENLFLGIIHNNEDFLAFLTALRDENLAKIMSQPRVLAMSGRPATLLSGGEQAIPEPGGLGVIGVRFEPFGTSLSVLPIVLGNGKIHLEIDPQISQLNQAFGTTIQGTSVPGRQTQRVHTVVEMEDGQMLAIGGLVEHTVEGSTTKVPVLGDIPFLGVFFSSKTYNDAETELLVVVTPHVVDPMSCAQAPKIFPGQETRNPDDFELFLEGILEAPRGQREVFPNHRYEAAYLNGPTASVYPCYGGGGVGPAMVGLPALDPAAPLAAPAPHGEAHPIPSEMPAAQAHAGPTLLAAPKRTAILLPSANWSQVNPAPAGNGSMGTGTTQGTRSGADLGPSGFDN